MRYEDGDEDVPVTNAVLIGPMVDIGAAACKKLPPMRRYRYSYPVRYGFANGEHTDEELKAMTKPKLEKEWTATQKQIADKQMFAAYRGGKFKFTLVRVVIRIGG